MAARCKKTRDMYHSFGPALARIISVICFVFVGACIGMTDTDNNNNDGLVGAMIFFLIPAVWLTIYASSRCSRRATSGFYLSLLTGKSRVAIAELAIKRKLPPKMVSIELYTLIQNDYMPGTFLETEGGAQYFACEPKFYRGRKGNEENAASRTSASKTPGHERKNDENPNVCQNGREKTAPDEEAVSAETRLVIEEGRSVIEAIKNINESLPDEAISEKLAELEKITEEIFKYVEKHPEKVSDIRKLMSYHLPAALKLANAYMELEAVPIKTDSVTAAKRDIRKALSAVTGAFEKILKGLYDDIVLDVSAEISALRVILAQDGLADTEDFPGISEDDGEEKDDKTGKK